MAVSHPPSSLLPHLQCSRNRHPPPFKHCKLSHPLHSLFTSLKLHNSKRSMPKTPNFSNDDSPYLIGVDETLPEGYEDWRPKKDVKDRRRAGILLHPTSLPGPYGIGDLGEETFHFLDWLHQAGCSLWQVLPLVPPDEQGSPYSGKDANCGNTLIISLEELVKDGLLAADELPDPIEMERVQFSVAAELKHPLIVKAAQRLVSSEGELKKQLAGFRKDPRNSGWLEDAAYFAAIDNTLDGALTWNEWPVPLRDRHLVAMEEIYHSEKDFIDTFIAQQFLFQRQWGKVRDYAKMKGIMIMGDMPIYVGYHSADVWGNKKLFSLDKTGFPILVSGVPPDAFSETGQLWGSPLYDWKAMENNGFSWWIKRIRRAYDLYDEFRIDHFRGIAGYWAVPYESKIATFGKWKAGPRKALFDAIYKAVGKISIVAEDLGVITEDVVQLRKAIGAPGMAVLQFAFGDSSTNPHLPHNHELDQVVYTGTHDNDTSRGWWESLKQEEKTKVLEYLSLADGNDISWKLIRVALSSVAQTAIMPMQDILGLDSSARMNIPATASENWNWRIPSSISFDSLETEAAKLKGMLSMYGRLDQ